MSKYNFDWVYQQLTEKKATRGAGDAAIKLLQTLEAIHLNEKQTKETVELFSKLAVNQPLVIPVEENEVWEPARPGAIKVGDTMMVLPNAYDVPELAVMHNGRRGKVVRISYGDIIIKYTDGKSPAIDGAHHSPNKLQKLVRV